MTTKTKTVSAAGKSRKTLAEARETLAERSDALAGVEAEIETVHRAWKAGSDSIPASRLTELQAEQMRLTPLIAAAERAVKMAERNLRTDNPELAEAVGLALGTSIHGVEPEIVTEVPRLDGEVEQPRVFVVQSRPHKVPGDGTVSGECSIRLVGPSWMQPLDAKAVERTLRKARVMGLGRNGLRSVNNTIDLSVTSAQPPVPTIRSFPEDKGQHVNVSSIGLEAIIEKETVDQRRGPLVEVRGVAGEVVRVQRDNGMRYATVEVAVTIVNNPQGYWDADTATARTRQILSDLNGDCLGVLGRITEVEHLSVEPVEHPVTGARARRIVTRFTTISKAAA